MTEDQIREARAVIADVLAQTGPNVFGSAAWFRARAMTLADVLAEALNEVERLHAQVNAHSVGSAPSTKASAEAVAPVEQDLYGDDPLVDVLFRALGNRTGKLKVSDAYLICGLGAATVNRDQIERLARAIRELGWERTRTRFDGTLEYAYVKGDASQREVALVVEYDPHTRCARIDVAGSVPKGA